MLLIDSTDKMDEIRYEFKKCLGPRLPGEAGVLRFPPRPDFAESSLASCRQQGKSAADWVWQSRVDEWRSTIVIFIDDACMEIIAKLMIED